MFESCRCDQLGFNFIFSRIEKNPRSKYNFYQFYGPYGLDHMMDQKIETITIENISETDEIGQERLSIHQRNTNFLPHLIWAKNIMGSILWKGMQWVEIVHKEKLSSVSHIANDDLKLKRIYDTHHLVKCCLTIGKG